MLALPVIASVLCLALPNVRGGAAPVLGGADDKVDIVMPQDGAYFAEVPAAVTVVVEVTNNSPLKIQEVHLDIDGQGHAMMCDGAGTCEWSVPLDEGPHEFRSYVVRNIGGPLFSQFVAVQVGGEAPDGVDDSDGDVGTSNGESGVDPSSDASGEATGAAERDPDAAADDGCACAHGGRRGRAWLLGLTVLGLAGRRRRAC